jgi:hypothetical protein
MLNRLIDNGRCIYNYIYICSRKSGPKKNQSFWCEHNKCGDMLMYNDTMIHGAVGRFRSRRSQPKLISWWRIFVVKLMVPVCSGISQIGQRTHTHTLTLWEYTQTHTQKNTKRGSTMINNDQHSPPRATLAPYISSYLLVLSMVVLFESVCLDPWRPTVRNNLYLCWLCYLYLPLPSWVKLSQYPLGPWVSFCVNEPWPFGLPICKNDQKCRFSEMEIAENQR